MPLAGYICCLDGTTKSFDTCIQSCRDGLCKHSLPLLSAMKMNADKRAGIGISSSVLNVCPRQFILSEREDFYEDPKDFYNRWRGSFGHYALEMGGPYPDIVQEVRFYRTMDVDGVPFTISGQPDWIDIGCRHISDAKFVGYAPKGPYQDHENQVNVYAWLVEGGYTMEENGHRYIPAGWRTETASVNYMDAKGEHVYPITLWTTEAMERFVRERLRPHKQYQETGCLDGIGIHDRDQEWKARYCPFARPENPGHCCMQDASVVRIEDYSVLEAA